MRLFKRSAVVSKSEIRESFRQAHEIHEPPVEESVEDTPRMWVGDKEWPPIRSTN